MMSDSTNALSEGRSVSETEVQDSLIAHITNPRIKGRIITTQFASNVYRFILKHNRLYSIKKAAELSDKKICFLGTSLNSYLEAAYFDGRAPFHPTELINEIDLKNIDPGKTIIVTTGSQGENRSTLNLSSLDQSPRLSLNPFDTLVYSAKIIPGNDKRVVRMLNRISNHGCKIIYGNSEKIHTSGHAYQEELKEILRIVKPKYFLPIHGEIISLNAHSRIALNECGIPNTIVLRNGQILSFEKKVNNTTSYKTFNITGELNLACYFNNNSSGIGTFDEMALGDRMRIAEGGLILIVIDFIKTKNNKNDVHFKSKFKIATRGIWTDRGKLNIVIRKIIQNILNKCRADISMVSLEQIVTETLGYTCYKINQSIPEILVQATELDF
mmetsp:Transcript_22508/g.31489  ORF Transcript_22508/g.31489 Transcript_22508/m.31489 type:complete len:385 (+) Transcript_22508:806-1960(+)